MYFGLFFFVLFFCAFCVKHNLIKLAWEDSKCPVYGLAASSCEIA